MTISHDYFTITLSYKKVFLSSDTQKKKKKKDKGSSSFLLDYFLKCWMVALLEPVRVLLDSEVAENIIKVGNVLDCCLFVLETSRKN